MEKKELKNNFFIEEYKAVINKEFNTVIENIDAICNKAKDPELYNISKSTQNNITRSPLIKRDNIRAERALKSPPKHVEVKSPILVGKKPFTSPKLADQHFRGLIKATDANQSKKYFNS
jgi:hypothetical protein